MNLWAEGVPHSRQDGSLESSLGPALQGLPEGSVSVACEQGGSAGRRVEDDQIYLCCGGSSENCCWGCGQGWSLLWPCTL